MILDCINWIIEFDLESGVYTDCSEDSATGKTFTTKLLNALIADGHEDILVLTYDNVNAAGVDKYINKIKNGKYNLIFADRANLYMNNYLYNALIESDAIVFMDIKPNGSGNEYYGKDCSIDFELGRIKYYVDYI